MSYRSHTPQAAKEYQYLVFDMETVPDAELISKVRTNGQKSPQEALEEYQAELDSEAKSGNGFIPTTYHIPVSIAFAKVRKDFSFEELTVLRGDELGPRKLSELFWEGWKYYKQPTFVSFNGRGFDIPVMEQMALRFAIPVPEWFRTGTMDNPRYRYNASSHLDLLEILTNYRAFAYDGGQNLAAKLVGAPGKLDTNGSMVYDLYRQGKYDDIHSYCQCDVLDAYLIFLRCKVLNGELSPEREKTLRGDLRVYLRKHAAETPVFEKYLAAWKE